MRATRERRSTRETRWPSTREEQSDRALVVRALSSLGRRQLRFTVGDVRRELTGNLGGALHYPGDLGRHVAALEPVTVLSVAQPLSDFMPECAAQDVVASRKSQHLYALAERERDLERSTPALTDGARVYVALCLAIRVHGTGAVSTHAVTEVCRAIPELAVDQRQQMSMRLKALTCRATPLVSKESACAADGTAQRWARWRPIGRGPDDQLFQRAVPAFDTWLETVQTLKGASADLGDYATIQDLVADIVTLAIGTTKSPHWPGGHPVSMEHIRSARVEHPEVRELCERVERRGTTIGKVLGDASKVRIVGRTRVQRRVIKVGSVAGEQTYYDVAGLKGVAERQRYVDLQGLRTEATQERLEELLHEFRDARSLTTLVACPAAAQALAAISAVRVLLTLRALEKLENRVQALVEERHTLSEITQRSVLALARRMSDARRVYHTDVDHAEAAAQSAVNALGLDLQTILDTPPPILIGDEYREWIPLQQRGTRTGPELMSGATTVRRHPNPAYRDNRSSDPREAARTGLDRVEALVHLAERQSASTLAFLQGGVRLLGKTLRDGSILTYLLSANDSKHWGGALAALAMLGHSAAETTARDVVSRGLYSDRVVLGIHALAVMRRGEGPWPSSLANDPNPLVSRALRAVLTAKRTGAWLL